MGEPENQYLHRSSNFNLRSSSHTSLPSHRQLPYTLLYFTHPVYFAVNVAVTSTACMAEHCCTHIWSLHVLTIGEQNCVEFSLVSLSKMQKPNKDYGWWSCMQFETEILTLPLNKMCSEWLVAVGLPKQRQVHCFGSPTVQLAHQHLWFCVMRLDRAKGLLLVSFMPRVPRHILKKVPG